MSLSSLKNKLYKKEADKDLASHAQSEYNPLNSSPDIISPETSDVWAEKKTGLGEKEKKAMRKGLWALGAIIGIVFLTVIGFEIRRFLFQDGDVTVSLTGPDQARSGKLLTYEIDLVNSNWVDMKNCVLRLSYPEEMKPEENPNFKQESPTSGRIDIGTIKKRGNAKVLFNAHVYSPKGALIYLKADLVYSPSGFSAQYEIKNQLGINVISTPLTLELQAPQNISSGDQVNYLVSYANNGAEPISSLKVKLDYPDGFEFSSSDPKVFESNNIWYLGDLAPGASGKIVATGILSGEQDQFKAVKAYIGTDSGGALASLSEESASTKIVASPLLISQTVNDLTNLNANAGDTLQFDLAYKNRGDKGLGNIIVKEKLDSAALDYSTLDLSSGSYDSDTKEITWKASDVPELKSLAPGASGKIGFTIKVKDVIPVSGANDKNYVISSVAKIDSPEIETPVSMNKIIAGNTMDIKLNSKIILDAKGYYDDKDIPNSGPVPPKSGQETTYTIHWKLTNVSNDIEKTAVTATLPSGVVMTGKTFPDGAHLSYDERSNTLVWDVGTVKAGAGVIFEPEEVSFQVKLKAAPNQVGNEATLVNEANVSARDLFTGADLKYSIGKKTTNLPEDPTLANANRVVN